MKIKLLNLPVQFSSPFHSIARNRLSSCEASSTMRAVLEFWRLFAWRNGLISSFSHALLASERLVSVSSDCVDLPCSRPGSSLSPWFPLCRHLPRSWLASETSSVQKAAPRLLWPVCLVSCKSNSQIAADEVSSRDTCHTLDSHRRRSRRSQQVDDCTTSSLHKRNTWLPFFSLL